MLHDKECALIFKALADETRIKILSLLCTSDMSMTEMLNELDIAQPTISYHIATMKEAGLINSNRCGTVKKCSINYDKLLDVQKWISSICKEKEEDTDCNEEDIR